MTSRGAGRTSWIVAWTRRILASPAFWGLLGWALLILRYTSTVVNPRYGGG